MLKDDSIGLGSVCREECVPKIGVYIRTAFILESNPVAFPVLFLVLKKRKKKKINILYIHNLRETKSRKSSG